MKRSLVAGISLIGLSVGASAFLWTTRVQDARAHCEVPCGIYDDPARIAAVHEDAVTIAKAVKQINELAGKHDAQSLNQAVRWVTTKEAHASHIMETVSQYFLAQRVKPVAPGAEGYDAYLKKLADHHAVMVAAMKAKQNADTASAEALHHAVETLAAYYEK